MARRNVEYGNKYKSWSVHSLVSNSCLMSTIQMLVSEFASVIREVYISAKHASHADTLQWSDLTP